jgi:diketogulonate reductase-like aldo/keto reductase
MLYGTAWKEDATAPLVALALQNGFRGVDTANQRKHYNEAAVGDAIGGVPRAQLFLQTKFTYLDGQDHRVPYDPTASLTDQVAQSMASSLEHLGTDYLDSYLLHGPLSGQGWTEADSEVWRAMQQERERGRARVLGVSNVSLRHLLQMPEVPAYVQNRCFARQGWDRQVRTFCRERGITYQGFSLLTANPEVFRHRRIAEIAAAHQATVAQVIFGFARGVGMLPLTGTTSAEHMQQDLAAPTLTPEEVSAIESISG